MDQCLGLNQYFGEFMARFAFRKMLFRFNVKFKSIEGNRKPASSLWTSIGDLSSSYGQLSHETKELAVVYK